MAALKAIDESLPFEVECDASDIAISAALNQGRHPVAFISKTLQGSELKYHIIKEVIAIVEVVWKWSHYLTRQHFTKIKNVEIQEWWLELSTLDYTIKYCPDEENVVHDTLSCAYICSLINSFTILDLHNGLCYPGITQLLHFVREKKPSLFYGGCKKGVFFMQNLC